MADLKSEFTRLIYNTTGEPVKSKYVYFNIQGDNNVGYQVFKTNDDGNLITSDNNTKKIKIIEGEYQGYITDVHVQEGAEYIAGKDHFKDYTEMKIHVVKGDSKVEEIKKKAIMLEVEDALFHFDSAVVLPEKPQGPSSEDGAEPSEETTDISGISVVYGIYNFLTDNPDKKMIIVGHTDTRGNANYNFNLSDLRAMSVLFLLGGERDNWANNCDKKKKVEDYQQILTHYVKKWGWDCDPDGVDNIRGPKTREAVRKFQETYNTEFKKEIDVDGDVGPDTWRAIFDCYMRELAEMADTTPDKLGEYRSRIKYVSDKNRTIGCGESYPIDEKHLDEYKSQTNRRVEVLFFDPGEVPVISCPHPAGPDEGCDIDLCPIYKDGIYDFEHIEPEEVGVHGISLLGEVEDHFAPEKESIDINYKIKDPEGKYKAGRIEIHGEKYPNNPVSIIPLKGDNFKPNTELTITWDGKCTCDSGPLKDGKYINPLYSPYKIIGAVSTIEDFSSGVVKSRERKETNVLFHSLEVINGTHTPDGTAPDKATEREKWVQHRLNELGYYGGPVDGDLTSNQAKYAINSFQHSHWKVGSSPKEVLTINGTLDDDTFRAIEAETEAREIFENDDWLKPDVESKLWTYDNFFFKPLARYWANQRQNDVEKKFMPRPHIPLEVKIYLKGKGEEDKKVESPKAVGTVTVVWELEPIKRTVTGLADPAKSYVENALKYVKDGTKTTAKDTKTGNNCHKDVDGFREDDFFANHKNHFLIGTKLQPFNVREDTSKKIVYSRVYNGTDYPDKQGRAGAYFMASHKGGDIHQIKVRLYFDLDDNAKELKKIYYDGDKPKDEVTGKTGRLVVWRRTKVLAVISDHAWKAGKAPSWTDIRDEYRKAFVELEDNGSPEITRRYKDVINNTTYTAIAIASGIPGPDVRYGTTAIYGSAAPAQNPTESPSDYFDRVRDDWWTPTVRPYVEAIESRLNHKILELLRREGCEGYVVHETSDHIPFMAKKLNAAGTALTAEDAWDEPFTFSRNSYADTDGIVKMSLDMEYTTLFLYNHEMGHNKFLQHWRYTGGAINTDHDHNDNHCNMTYVQPGTSASAWVTTFCGKCLLRLAGWDVQALPQNY